MVTCRAGVGEFNFDVRVLLLESFNRPCHLLSGETPYIQLDIFRSISEGVVNISYSDCSFSVLGTGT